MAQAEAAVTKPAFQFGTGNLVVLIKVLEVGKANTTTARATEL